MNADKLQHAITLGKKIQHFFMALVGSDGFPYVNSARRIDRVADNQFADDIQLSTVARPPVETPPRQDTDAEVSVCGFAPEWAEHARFDRDDAPCDDGRAGRVHEPGATEP